jgi:hypothetical protein
VSYDVIMTDLTGDGIIANVETLSQAIAIAREKVTEGWPSAAVFKSEKCLWNASLVAGSSSLH